MKCLYDAMIFANENNGSGSVYYAVLYDSCILKYCDDARKKFCYEDNYFYLFASKNDKWCRLRSIYFNWNVCMTQQFLQTKTMD